MKKRSSQIEWCPLWRQECPVEIGKKQSMYMTSTLAYPLDFLFCSQETLWVVILSSVWMGHALFFALGNSNSLASVDISTGYVGLEDFVPSIMGPLTYVATYCGPCLWLTAGVLAIVRNATDAKR